MQEKSMFGNNDQWKYIKYLLIASAVIIVSMGGTIAILILTDK